MAAQYDVIVVGSGAGGASAAYKLVNAGKRVLLIEKGPFLPRNSSTLQVKQVFVDGVFKNHVVWLDSKGREFVPGEFYNVGGKTKWYGAALFRFRPVEFEADPDYGVLGWPFGYEELKPYYDEATDLLEITSFKNEPQLQALLDKITTADPAWELHPLPLGLSKDIVNHPEEAKHFDGFASPSGLKSDSERNLIDQSVTSRTSRCSPVIPSPISSPRRGIRARSSASNATTARPMRRTRCARRGRHDVSAYPPGSSACKRTYASLRRSRRRQFQDAYQLGSARLLAVQGSRRFAQDSGPLQRQLPPFLDAVPRLDRSGDARDASAAGDAGFRRQVSRHAGDRVLGDHRGLLDPQEPHHLGRAGGKPIMDYSLDRIPNATKEHHALIDYWIEHLLGAGLAGVDKYMGMAGTAHALGSMVTGDDPKTSVVDPHGKVHGMERLYVGDGSPLPRASRVNPSLTIYAWGFASAITWPPQPEAAHYRFDDCLGQQSCLFTCRGLRSTQTHWLSSRIKKGISRFSLTTRCLMPGWIATKAHSPMESIAVRILVPLPQPRGGVLHSLRLRARPPDRPTRAR